MSLFRAYSLLEGVGYSSLLARFSSDIAIVLRNISYDWSLVYHINAVSDRLFERLGGRHIFAGRTNPAVRAAFKQHSPWENRYGGRAEGCPHRHEVKEG